MAERNIVYFENNPSLAGQAEIIPDVVFSTAQGQDLKLTVISPWRDREHETEPPRFPLIVFLQGSAWTFPNVNYEIPQLSDWARRGYVVATITHRNSMEGHPFPAFLQDSKTAIRFLRANADTYGIDPARVCFWGTSSGGNTALLVGLTGDDPRYKTEEYADQSDAVKTVVECFGPTDMLHFGRLSEFTEPLNPLVAALAGTQDKEGVIEAMRNMSPIYWVEEGKEYPPFLILHGDADPVVPYDQGLRMYDELLSKGADVSMACVKGAPHEGSFWSRALLDYIADFISARL